MAIRILLVDDHALFRKAICSLLTAEPDFTVVGEAATGIEALEKTHQLLPDLVLMDLSLPDMHGAEATRRLRAALPSIPIVILTASDTDQDVFAAFEQGARGYLLKETDAASFFRTLRAVAAGQTFLPGQTAAKVLREFARRGQAAVPSAPDEQLSGRERDVLRLVALGTSNKEIALRLGISAFTVKNHIQRILKKLKVESRVQAALYALKRGIDSE
jgi:DNA-binding NarL/FixJ family response regulator